MAILEIFGNDSVPLLGAFVRRFSGISPKDFDRRPTEVPNKGIFYLWKTGVVQAVRQHHQLEPGLHIMLANASGKTHPCFPFLFIGVRIH